MREGKRSAGPALVAGLFVLGLSTAPEVIGQDERGEATIIRRPAARGEPLDTAGKREFALTVGIETYGTDTIIDTLDYAADDAIEVGAVLKRAGYSVVSLVNGKWRPVLNAPPIAGEPTKQAILEQLDRVCRAARAVPGSTVVVFFAGHGKLLKVDSKDASFVFPQYTAPVNPDNRQQLSIDIQKDVVGRLRNTENGVRDLSTRKFLFIDACRSQKGGNSLDPDVTLSDAPDPLEPVDVEILFSCHDRQKSREFEQLEHGVFSYYLIHGLKGEAAGESENSVSFLELYTFLDTNVAGYVKRHGHEQKPYRPDNPRARLTEPVIRVKKPGSAGTVYSRVSPSDLAGFPQPLRNITSFDYEAMSRNGEEFIDLTFTGDFSGIKFYNNRFRDCRFERCTFSPRTRLSGAIMVDCVFERDCQFQRTQARGLTLKGRAFTEGLWPTEIDKKPKFVRVDE